MRTLAALVMLAVAGQAGAQEPARALLAVVQATDQGCSSSTEPVSRTEWLDEDTALYSLTVWLNSRESIQGGPVDIERVDNQVVAFVPVYAEEVVAGQPVATCVRPVLVELQVEFLPRSAYTWVLRRGTRAEARAQDAKAHADAGTGAATAAPAGKDPPAATDPVATPAGEPARS